MLHSTLLSWIMRRQTPSKLGQSWISELGRRLLACKPLLFKLVSGISKKMAQSHTVLLPSSFVVDLYSFLGVIKAHVSSLRWDLWLLDTNKSKPLFPSRSGIFTCPYPDQCHPKGMKRRVSPGGEVICLTRMQPWSFMNMFYPTL